MDSVNCLVIGGGVIGLAVAREICQTIPNSIVVEASNSFGQGISSRNSEVIHAGIYYPTETLKAQLCVEGKHLLYQYCASHRIKHVKCGKVIVSTCSDDDDRLFDIASLAQKNGVDDIVKLSKKKLATLEPKLKSSSAILSPSTGIIDSHGLMTSFVSDIEALGGHFIPNSPVTRIIPKGRGYDVSFVIDGSEYFINAKIVINCGGISATKIANNIEGFPKDCIPQIYLCKGTYFGLSGIQPFKHLVYPVPPKRGDGLGIHATLDLQGNVRFGPDVEYISDENYIPDNSLIDIFYDAVSKYYPSLRKGQLYADYCGVRPKLQGPNDGFMDFEIHDGLSYGFPGLIQLFGIESPGLTSCLSIAKHVSRKVNQL